MDFDREFKTSLVFRDNAETFAVLMYIAGVMLGFGAGILLLLVGT